MATTPNNPPTILDQFARPLRQGDPWGGAYDPPRDPLKDEKKVRDEAAGAFYRQIPLTTVNDQWSISGIRSALQDHKIGQWQSTALLCDSVFGDDRVQATLGSRTGGLFSQSIQFHRRGHGRKYSHRALKAWRKAWPKILPQAVGSEILRWAVMIGFGLNEIRWDTSGKLWQPYLVPWHPYFDLYRWDLHQHQLSTLDGPVAAIPGTGKWFVFAPHGQYRGWIQGAIRATAERWFLKQLAWRDWARFNERHGLPIIKAKVPAAGDPLQKRAFVNSMSTMGQQAVIGLPQNVDGSGYDADLLEARDRSWESFPALIDRVDRSLVLPILWQNLTTEVKEGSYAAARVHGDVRQSAIEFDNQTLAEAIYQQIARPWALFNFGDPDVAPYTCWDVRPVEDFAAKSEALLRFAQAMMALRNAGMRPKYVERLARRFGIELDQVDAVDPMQVEARLVQATGKKEDEDHETLTSLKAAYRDVRREVVKLHNRIRQYQRAA